MKYMEAGNIKQNNISLSLGVKLKWHDNVNIKMKTINMLMQVCMETLQQNGTELNVLWQS